MINTRLKKTLAIGIIILIALTAIQINVNAYSASPTSVTLEIGESKTITVTASNEVVQISASSSNSAVATVSGGTADGILDSEENGTKQTTYTIKAVSAGTATISFTPTDYSSYGSGSASTLSVSVTVKAAATPTPTPTSGDSGSSSSGSSSSTPEKKELTFKDVSKTVYVSSDNTNLRKDWSTTSGAIQVDAGTELRLTGIATEKVNGYTWYRVTYNGSVRYVASSLVTETKPEEKEEKSNNVDLKSIEITGAELNPKFSNSVTEYTVVLDKDFKDKELKIKAEPVDEKTKVTIEGNKDIKVGENTIKITAKAEDDTTRITTIKVTKPDASAFGLATLTIKDVKIDKFATDKLEYSVQFSESDKLDITAIATDADAKVEIIGNENLKEGENIITIMVTSKDGEKTVTYQIKATKTAATAQVINKKLNPINLALCGLFALIAVIIISLLIMKYVRDKREDDDYYDSDDYNPYHDIEDNDDEVKGKKNRRNKKNKKDEYDSEIEDEEEIENKEDVEEEVEEEVEEIEEEVEEDEISEDIPQKNDTEFSDEIGYNGDRQSRLDAFFKNDYNSDSNSDYSNDFDEDDYSDYPKRSGRGKGKHSR